MRHETLPSYSLNELIFRNSYGTNFEFINNVFTFLHYAAVMPNVFILSSWSWVSFITCV